MIFALAILMSFISAKDHEDIDTGHEVVADLIQDTDDFEHANPKTNEISTTTRDAHQFPQIICRPSGNCVEVPEFGGPSCTIGPFGPPIGCTCIPTGTDPFDKSIVVC